MSDSPHSTGDAAVLAEVREAMARPFAESIAAGLPQVMEIIEQQLALTQERENWKPLRGALQLLGGMRTSLGARVQREVAARFDAKVAPGDDAFGKTARFSLESLSLVADHQVQEEISLGNASKRLKDQVGDELFALTQRMAVVMGKETLPDDRNPVYPRTFTRGLLDALVEPGGDSAARLAAFAAFDPVMLEVVDEIYHSVNRMLRDRGVLPDFKRSYGAPVQTPTRAAPQATTGMQGAVPAVQGTPMPAGGMANDAAPASPAGMLEQLFAAAANRPTISVTQRPVMAVPPGMITIQVRPEMVAALRALESRLDTPSASDAGTVAHASAQWPSAGGIAPGTETYPASSAEVHRAKAQMRDTLTPADVVIADLVAALFDRLFVDPRLSDSTKAQVGRLQLPVFKAVMQDRTFFTERAHPIRGLIDVVAELGASDESIRVESRSPAEWIAAMVAELLARHGEDAQAFVSAHRKLGDVLERHRAAAIEADEQVLAIRHEEHRLAAVRDASLEIAHRLAAGQYPEEGASFLYRCWRDVLVFDFLEGGDKSPNWSADLEVLDDVLWILIPRTSNEDRARLVSLLPSLLFRLKMGFARAGMPAEAAAQNVEELKQLLDEVMRAPMAAAHGSLRRRPESAPVFKDDYTATLHVSSASLAEEGLARGTWIEFTEPDGTRRRCRLTWMSPVQGTCLFKDLERNRSFAISLDEVREKRRAGLAVPVDGPGVAQSSIEGALSDVARAMGAAAQ
jgi:Protein of unknown function (DUF1631)